MSLSSLFATKLFNEGENNISILLQVIIISEYLWRHLKICNSNAAELQRQSEQRVEMDMNSIISDIIALTWIVWETGCLCKAITLTWEELSSWLGTQWNFRLSLYFELKPNFCYNLRKAPFSRQLWLHMCAHSHYLNDIQKAQNSKQLDDKGKRGLSKEKIALLKVRNA